MFICSITGKEATEPVVSTKSGHIYEKRIILKTLAENGGECPFTKVAMDPSTDLVTIKTPLTNNQDSSNNQMTDEDDDTTNFGNINARNLATTSIPGMLQQFQNEWDTLMVEQFTLKQHLDQVRSELAHALYQHDAACRVIARLLKEKEQLQANAVSHPDQMKDDVMGMTKSIIQNMSQAAAKLYESRKKRRISSEIKSAAQVKELKHTSNHLLHGSAFPTSIAIRESDAAPLSLTGGSDGRLSLFNLKQQVVTATLTGHRKSINAVGFHPDMDILLSASNDNSARIWTSNENGEYASYYTLKHQAPVTGLTVQVTGDYFVTSSSDNSWSFFDMGTGAKIISTSSNESLDSVQFHPDGLILGTGTGAGNLLLWDVKSQSQVASLEAHKGSCHGLSFSENGYLVATCGADQTVRVYDLRALKKRDGSESVVSMTKNDVVNDVSFDNSGMYLAMSAGNVVDIYQTKQWNQLTSLTAQEGSVTALGWGKNAHAIAVASEDRGLHLYHN
mmetsp:Transcript_7362/g.10849  ORF Transcript_7362/g.10849 Transcript_7362/m.10849 type:complete len:505 (+) Transcript_7362:61-1575(+)